MTCTEQSYNHNGHTTVATVDWDAQVATIKSSATQIVFNVYKPYDQTPFFKIGVNRARPPASLEGHWNGIQKAVEAIVKYLTDSGETQTVKNNRLDKERKERNAAKLDSKGR